MALALDSRNDHIHTGTLNHFWGSGNLETDISVDNSTLILYDRYASSINRTYYTSESEMSLPSSMIHSESYLNFWCGSVINRRIQPKGCRIFLFDITTSTADSLGREYLGEIRKGNQLWTRQLRYWALVRYCQDASALHIPEPGYVVTYRTALVSFHFKCIALHFL